MDPAQHLPRHGKYPYTTTDITPRHFQGPISEIWVNLEGKRTYITRHDIDRLPQIRKQERALGELRDVLPPDKIQMTYKSRPGLHIRSIDACDVLSSMLSEVWHPSYVSKEHTGTVEILVQEAYGDEMRMNLFKWIYFDVNLKGYAWSVTCTTTLWHMVLDTVAVPHFTDMSKALRLGDCAFIRGEHSIVTKYSDFVLTIPVKDESAGEYIHTLSKLLKYGDARGRRKRNGDPPCATADAPPILSQPSNTPRSAHDITAYLRSCGRRGTNSAAPSTKSPSAEGDEREHGHADPVAPCTSPKKRQRPISSRLSSSAPSPTKQTASSSEIKRMRYTTLRDDDPLWDILRCAEMLKLERMRDLYREGSMGIPLPSYPSPHILPGEISWNAHRLVKEKDRITAEIRTMESRLAVLKATKKAIIAHQNNLRLECKELDPAFDCKLEDMQS